MNSKALIAGVMGGVLVLLLGSSCIVAGTVLRQKAAIQRARIQAEIEREKAEYRKDALAAFKDPVPPKPHEAAEFRKVLDALGRALDRGREAEIDAYFHTERFVKELGRRGALDTFPGGNTSRNRTTIANSIRKEGGFGRTLAQNTLFRWQETRVRRVRWSADRKEAVVIAVHKEAADDDEPVKVRWWLANDGLGWKVYDLEELDIGVRVSEFAAIIIPAALEGKHKLDPEQFRTTMDRLREAILAIVHEKDAEKAEGLLARIRGVDLPPPAAALRAIVDGCIQLEHARPEAALARCDEADRLHPGMPIVNLLRAIALAAGNRPAEALPLVQRYLAELGPDPKACLVEGNALEQLQRKAEAADAYRRALDDMPGNAEALDGLRRVLPAGDKSELSNLLAKAKDPAKLYPTLVELARADGDDAAAAALFAGFRKARPDDKQETLKILQEMVEAERYKEALLALKTLFSENPSEEDRWTILAAYIVAMRRAKHAEEAYAAVPDRDAPRAFHFLADGLEDRILEPDDDRDAAAAAKELRTLLDAHRKRAGADPWLLFFDAVLLQSAKDYEKAEGIYAAGQRLYLKTRKQARVGEPDDDAERFRERRVECLYALKRGTKAYEEVGPPIATFRQLANLYAMDEDFGALEDLLRAHRQAFPKDPARAFWAADLLYRQEKYEAAGDAFRQFFRMPNPEHYRSFLAVDRCIRAYLRADSPADAESVLSGVGKDEVSASLRAAVTLAEGTRIAAEELLADLAGQRYGLQRAYADPDFAREISKPQFAELRNRYPKPKE